MKYSAELYRPSPRPYHGLSELSYPSTTTQCICMAPHKIMLSAVFAGQNVGVKQVGDRIWPGRLLADLYRSGQRRSDTDCRSNLR